MKNTVNAIEDTILGTARQTTAQFDRTRFARTSAIESLLGDIGFDFEEKPAQDEDDAGIEEILAGAEAINSSFEARYGYPWIPVGATVTASRRLKGIKEGECYTVSRSDVTDDGPTIWLEEVAGCYRMDCFEEVEEVEG